MLIIAHSYVSVNDNHPLLPNLAPMYPPNSLRWEKMNLRDKNGCWFCNVAKTGSVVRQKAQLLLFFLLYSITELLTVCKCTVNPEMGIGDSSFVFLFLRIAK